jgi:hypothetical protein
MPAAPAGPWLVLLDGQPMATAGQPPPDDHRRLNCSSLSRLAEVPLQYYAGVPDSGPLADGAPEAPVTRRPRPSATVRSGP